MINHLGEEQTLSNCSNLMNKKIDRFSFAMREINSFLFVSGHGTNNYNCVNNKMLE